MRDDAYRAAFEEANAELKEISSQIDQLQQRQTRLERVAEVLKPLAETTGATQFSEPLKIETHHDEAQQFSEPASAPQQENTEPAAVPAASYAETSSDPFQRRINNALRQGFGSGDGREYSRLFSGLSRGH